MSTPHTQLITQYDEIAEVVFSIMAQDATFASNVWWFSVGLINDSLEIHWKSYVNYSSKHAEAHCGDGKEKKAACKPMKGEGPPCPSQMSCMCEFRKNLVLLEKETMEEGAHSLGLVSLLKWEQHGESPYISAHRSRYSWMTEKGALLKSLHALIPKMDKSRYATLAEKCTKDGLCSVALAPLVQHRFSGDLAYVGAVVICGSKSADGFDPIRHQSHWQKLSLLKALAMPLLESARWLKGIPTLRNKERPHDLFYEVLLSDLRKNSNLFQGSCPEKSGCAIHNARNSGTRKRHGYDCRLERQNRLFADAKRIFSKLNSALGKSLFSFGNLVPEGSRTGRLVIANSRALKATKPQASHYCSLSEINTFFRNAFNIPSRITGNAEILVSWPFRPGLITAIGLAHLWESLNDEAKQYGQTTRLRIFAKEEKAHTTLCFAFSLVEDCVQEFQERLKWLDLPENRKMESSPGQTIELLNELKFGIPTCELQPPSVDALAVIAALKAASTNPVLGIEITKNKSYELQVSWPFKGIAKASVARFQADGTSIHVYNHDNETLPLQNELCSAGLKFLGDSTETNTSADLVIIHCPEDAAAHDVITRRQILNGKLPPGNLRRNGVLIFVSSVGVEESISPKRQGHFFVFGIRKAVSKSGRGCAILLTKKQWSAIFDWAAKSKGKKRLHELEALATPTVKRLLWSGGEEMRFSRALAVLCQGYLAAHRRKGTASLSVQDGGWWLTPFQKTLGTKSTPRLCKLIRDEWNDRPAEVELLLRRIQVGKVNQPAVVMSAYQEMCSRRRSNRKTTARNTSDSAITLPNKIFLVGDGLETATLAHCLSMLTDVVQIAPASLTKQIEGLDSDSNAVIVLGLDGNSSAVWRLLSRIRLKHRWKGRVLIILPSNQKRQFDENVFIQRQNNTYPAHGFVSRPLDVNSLLRSAKTLRPYRQNGFEEYLAKVKAISRFETFLKGWDNLQTFTDDKAQGEAGRNLGQLLLKMEDSVRKSIMTHAEKQVLTLWIEGNNDLYRDGMGVLKTIVAHLR